jgi:hypothetical protein
LCVKFRAEGFFDLDLIFGTDANRQYVECIEQGQRYLEMRD